MRLISDGGRGRESAGERRGGRGGGGDVAYL